MKKLIEIKIDEVGTFLERPNRFISKVKLKNGNVELVHVHDSGRIKELLYEGNKVFIKQNIKKTRKTKWDLIGARAEDGEIILLNSAYHRRIADKIFNDFLISPFGKVDSIKAEVKYKNSRLDYLVEKPNEKIWVETKGVSLSVEKLAMFPDAPTIRGQKHLKELIELKKRGERAAVVFLVFRDSNKFRPKWETDIKFSELFYEAIDKGVEVYPIQLYYDGQYIYYKKIIDIEFN